MPLVQHAFAAALPAQQRGECHMAARSLVMAPEAKSVLGSGEQFLFVRHMRRTFLRQLFGWDALGASSG
jgi:hypothetical protein